LRSSLKSLRFLTPSLQQPASLNCQIIQRHFQLRDRRADLRVLSDFLWQSFKNLVNTSDMRFGIG